MKSLLVLALIFSLQTHADVSTGGPLADAADKSKAVEEDEAEVLQRHYPFYFAYGHKLSKLQLSFKTPIVRKVPLYLGYTQLMFWALNDNSKPFRDLTYNPELFYRLDLNNLGALRSLDFGIFNHNSNGKAGADSRSYNKSYLRANFEQSYLHWIARFGIQVADLYGFDPTNRDIQDYIGPLGFSLSFIQLFEAWIDKSELSFQANPGGKFANRWDRGGYQLSWSFRLGGIHLVPAFYTQYYHGFAETLLNYNQRVDTFRAGIIF